MSIKLIEDKMLWDNFIDESDYGLLFHKWDFLKIMEKHTKCKLLSYGIYKGDMLICVFPLFFKKTALLNSVFSPPPKTGVPNLGFVMSAGFDKLKQDKKENNINIMGDEISEELKTLSLNYISISTVSNFLDVRPFKWNEYNIMPQHQYVIDLSDSLETIWAGVTGGCRKKVKNLENKEVILKESNDVTKFYELYKMRYDEQNLILPLSKDYIVDVINKFENNVHIYYLCDSNKDKILGALLTVKYKDRFTHWLGNVRATEVTGVNEYINWELIKMAKTNGYKKFVISGAGTRRLCQFKSKFNPSLEISFDVCKKDNFGKVAEWIYFNFIKKRRF